MQKPRQHLRAKTVTSLIEELARNDWPLGAKDRPFTYLGHHWSEQLGEHETRADRERKEQSEKDCLQWRARLNEFLQDCRRHLIDHGDSVQMRRFEGNKLVRVLSASVQVDRELYFTPEVLSDLKSLKALVIGFRHGPIQDGKGELERIRQGLKRAVDIHPGDHTAAAKEMNVNRDTLEDFLGRRVHRPQPETVRKYRHFIARYGKATGK